MIRLIYIVGIKHSGKSSVGRFAAQLCGHRFTDTDDLIQKQLPKEFPSIRQFYQERGKEAFMELEYRCISSFVRNVTDTPQVISTGGGASDNERLVSLMRESGTIIYLAVEESALLTRILRNGIPPFLATEDPGASFSLLFAERDARYRQISDIVLPLPDYRSVPENARTLAQCLVDLTGSEEPCRGTRLEQH